MGGQKTSKNVGHHYWMFPYEKIMRFKVSPQLPGAERTRAWLQNGSHPSTSPGIILLVKRPVTPNISAASVDLTVCIIPVKSVFCHLPVVVENHPSGGTLSRPSASFDISVPVAVYVIEGLRSLSMALALKNTFVSPEVKKGLHKCF
jgi:hypothetical protein